MTIYPGAVCRRLLTCCFFAVAAAACKDPAPDGQDAPPVAPALPAAIIQAPAFNEDTAFAWVQKQVSFGPRTPGSKGQLACAAWMQNTLKASVDTVYRQETTVRGGDGKQLPCINIIGAIHPQAARRILLLAHWDSRPWADQDTAGKDKPIDAADDAGSGVAVLLELCRVLKANPLPADLGVDVLMTDVEDYGKTQWGDSSYCLGTQYWALHPHVPGYTAAFGILLDMVGARGASFPLEQISAEYAGNIQQNIWQAAGRAGFSSYFPFRDGGRITDDHVVVNELAHIPTVDIIHLRDDSRTGFAPHWHTHADNMSIIDKGTLKAVGQTLLQVLFEAAKPAV